MNPTRKMLVTLGVDTKVVVAPQIDIFCPHNNSMSAKEK